MKFALIALIAAAVAADASDYQKCAKGGDCSGSNICCSVTKKADSSPAAAGLQVCVPALGDGTIPKDAKTTPYAGYTYFCSKAHHTDPTNPPAAPKIVETNADGTPKQSGAAALAATATSAAVAAFIMA